MLKVIRSAKTEFNCMGLLIVNLIIKFLIKKFNQSVSLINMMNGKCSLSEEHSGFCVCWNDSPSDLAS